MIAIYKNHKLIQAPITQIKLRIFNLLPFCPIFASIIVISFILSMLGTLLYAKYSVAVNGNFSTEIRFKKYWKLREIDEKPLKNYAKKDNWILKKNYEKCFKLNSFQLKNEPIAKMRFRKYCVRSEILTKNIMIKSFFFNGFSEIFQWVFNISKHGFQCWNSL